MYHLDIPKTRQYDTGKIEVIARSSVGEALATTDLKVVQRKDDYRGVLKNSPRRKCLPLQIHSIRTKNTDKISRQHFVYTQSFNTKNFINANIQSTSTTATFKANVHILTHKKITLTQHIASCKEKKTQTNRDTCPLSKCPISPFLVPIPKRNKNASC